MQADAWWNARFEPGGIVDGGVLRFSDGPDPWVEGLRDLAREHWIETNWHRGAANVYRDIALYEASPSQTPSDEGRVRWVRHLHDVAFVDGPICEVAAGPGGGLVPALLTWNPRAHIPRAVQNERSGKAGVAACPRWPKRVGIRTRCQRCRASRAVRLLFRV